MTVHSSLCHSESRGFFHVHRKPLTMPVVLKVDGFKPSSLVYRCEDIADGFARCDAALSLLLLCNTL